MTSGFPSKLILIAVAALSLGATVRADSIQVQVAADEAAMLNSVTSFLVFPPVIQQGIPVVELSFGFATLPSDQFAKDFTMLWQLDVEGFSFGGFEVAGEAFRNGFQFFVPERVIFGNSLPHGDHNDPLPGRYTSFPVRLDVSIFSDFGVQSAEGFNLGSLVQEIPSPPPTPTPEPGTLLLFGTGIGALGWLGRRNLSRRTTR